VQDEKGKGELCQNRIMWGGIRGGTNGSLGEPDLDRKNKAGHRALGRKEDVHAKKSQKHCEGVANSEQLDWHSTAGER